jgi:hypothetical protein
MRSLREDSWRLVRSGKTSLAEVLRATKDERFNGNGLKAEEPDAGIESVRSRDRSVAEASE